MLACDFSVFGPSLTQRHSPLKPIHFEPASVSFYSSSRFVRSPRCKTSNKFFFQEFEVFVYLRQQWVDKRLAHGIDASLALGATDVGRIWLPDTYITNANDYEVFTSNQLVLINGIGQVFYFAYVRIAGACQMNLVKFPMDVQRCHLTLESCKCGVGRGERGEGREGKEWKEHPAE